MNAFRITRRLRRALLQGATLAALSQSVALAGPVAELPADFNGGPYQVGASIYPAAGAILGARGAAVVYQPGHYAGHRYCNPFGPNTRLAEVRIRAIRWHTQQLTGFMCVNTPAGESWRVTSDAMGVGVHHYGFVGAGGAGPGECVSLEYYQSGATQGDRAGTPPSPRRWMPSGSRTSRGPRSAGSGHRPAG